MRRVGPHLRPGLLAGAIMVASGLAASAVTASAADLPVPGAPPAAPAYRPVIYDWSGIYVGGQVGAGTMSDTFTQLTTTALFNAGATTRTNPWSVVGGAEAGFNIEFAPVVVGFEGTWTSSYLSGTQTTASLLPTISINDTSASHWYATATGRVGYAANDILFYVKGGAAWMRVTYTEAPAAGGIMSMQSINDTRTGWTVGGGIEYGLNENLSLKVEYDFYDFGTKNYGFNNLSYTPVGGAITAVALPASIQSVASLVTAGVNYRFNWH
jgi:outer membrane immunogenic protein